MRVAGDTFTFTLLGKDKLSGPFGNAADGMGGVLGQAKAIGGPVLKVAGAALAGLGVAAGAAAYGIYETVQSASDLGESVNAVNVTFGEAADGVLKLSENAATTVGLAQKDFNSLAVRFSSFADTVAGDGGDVVGVLDDLTRRSADFASVMNIDVTEAAQTFQSALAGETEPIKQYGIDLSAAAVEAHALAEGIHDGTGEMTEAQKVQARYSLLMAETAKTAGDFANTSDSLANRQRILKAELENTKAEIGSAFLPVVEELFGVFTEVGVPALRDLADWFVENKDQIRIFVLTAAEMSLNFAATMLDMAAAGAGMGARISGAAADVVGVLFDLGISALETAATVADALGFDEAAREMRQGVQKFEQNKARAVGTLEQMERGGYRMERGLRAAAAGARGLASDIGKLRSKDIRINVNTVYSTTGSLSTVVRPGQVGMLAGGGDVDEGRPYFVGEQGMELFVPDEPGRVIDADTVRAMLASMRDSASAPITAAAPATGSGGPLVQIGTFVAQGMTPDEVADALAWELRT